MEELRTPNFRESEFRCKCEECRQEAPHECQPVLLLKLQELREVVDRPLRLTSAYRCPNHHVERRKRVPGTHAQGLAADIYVANGAEAYEIMKEAFALGFHGIANGGSFVHVDVRETTPVSWTY